MHFIYSSDENRIATSHTINLPLFSSLVGEKVQELRRATFSGRACLAESRTCSHPPDSRKLSLLTLNSQC